MFTILRARRRAGFVNYVRENLTAIQNFAEYLMPGGDRFGRRTEARARRHTPRRLAQDRRLPRPRRQNASALGGLHASRLPRALEFDRAVLGLPVPWLAIRAGRDGRQWPGDSFSCPRRAVERSPQKGRSRGVIESRMGSMSAVCAGTNRLLARASNVRPTRLDIVHPRAEPNGKA